jgi:tetratricopeptide (TPR) repeat protein
MLKRQGLISSWHDRDISAGRDWASEIDAHLNTSQIILLLVSPDYIDSDYCYGFEMKRALERDMAGETHVVPIILRPVDWEFAPLGHLQPLPTNGKPITDWQNQDSAFLDVARGIRRVVEGLITEPTQIDPRGGIVALPPPTNPKTIQQRGRVVKDIYARLTQPDITALVLTGIGGVGKSTLAALVRDYAEKQRLAGSELFTAEPLWLTISPAFTMADLATSLFDALGKSIRDFGFYNPQYQAVELFNAMKITKQKRLVILDQFENLLDGRTGHALTDRPGVGEWLDAINSQQSTYRVLLTSRLWPQGTHEFPPTYMQEYSVKGLEVVEGIELLRKQGGDQVSKATEVELRSAVERCDGHALALTLLASLLRTRNLSLASFFREPIYAQIWSGNVARNVLDCIYTQHLNDRQRKLLLAFSVYRKPVQVSAAQTLLDVDGEELNMQAHSDLEALLNQHLLQSGDEGLYQLHTIVANYARSHFVEGNERANQQALRTAHAKAARHYLEYASSVCPPREKRRRASDVEPLVETVWQLCQAEQYREAYDLMVQEHLFTDLMSWGENSVLLELCQLLLQLENWHPKRSEEADIYNVLGAVYGVLGQVELGSKYSDDALNICREIGYRKGEGTALGNLGKLYDVVGQREQALEYYEGALAIYTEIEDRNEIALTGAQAASPGVF